MFLNVVMSDKRIVLFTCGDLVAGVMVKNTKMWRKFLEKSQFNLYL